MGSTPDFPQFVVASDCTVPVATIVGVFIPYFCENQTVLGNVRVLMAMA